MTLYQGGYQATLVKQRDDLVVIEAPVSSARSRAVIADAATRYPGTPIRAVISTSPMWMHIGGLAEYAARGIPIYVLDTNAAIVTRLLKAQPAARRPAIRIVCDTMTVGAGDNRLRLIPVRGLHGAAQMFVYWPARRLLYASDMVIPPTAEPVFTAAYKAELTRTIARLGLPVTTVYGLHIPASAR